jgi:hypothetical protein
MHLDIELLSAYIDDEVTPAEASQVEHHLQVCRDCAEELESLRWTVHLLREVPPIPVPRSFAIRPIDIQPEPAPQRFRWPDWLFNSLQWATVVTAILTVLVFSVDFLGRSQPASAPTSTLAQTPEEQATLMADQVTRESAAASEAAEESVQAMATAPVEIRQEQTNSVAAAPQPAPASGESAVRQAQEQPAPDQPKAESAQEVTSETYQAQGESPPQSAEARARQADSLPGPTPAPESAGQPLAETSETSSTDTLRATEIGLTILFIVLLGLTLWTRRQRRA